MKNTVIKYGFFALVTSAIFFLAALVLGKDLSMNAKMVLGYAVIVVSLLFVFFGIKHYRDHENEGHITFRKAFIIGIFISIFAAIGFAIIDYIYTAVINPNYISEYIQAEKDSGMTGEIPSYTSASLAIFMFLIVVIIGIIISILSGLILQRK